MGRFSLTFCAVSLALLGCGDSTTEEAAPTSRGVLRLVPLLEQIRGSGEGPDQEIVESWPLPHEGASTLPPVISSLGPVRAGERAGVVFDPAGEPRQPQLLITTPLQAEEINLALLHLKLVRDAGTAVETAIRTGRLEWRGPDEAFAPERSIQFTLPPEASYRFEMCPVPVGDHPLWRGEIEGVRLVLAEEPTAVALTQIVLARASFALRLQLAGRSQHRVQIGGITRETVIAPLPGVHRAELAMPEDARLRVALGGDPSFLASDADIEFRVVIESRGERSEVARERWSAESGSRSWRPWEVDLSAFAGEKVTIELRAEAPGARKLAAALWGEPLLLGGEQPYRPSFVLISLDTLRADHLSTYGYDVPTSPHIDALGEEGFVFERAHAQAPYTLPSHASLFTSLYPAQHGFLEDLAPPEDEPTMAGILSEAGYRTAGFTDGGFMTELFGMGLGFGEFDDTGEGVETVFSRGLDWLHTVGGEPFFLFLHTYEIHSPYDAPQEFRRPVSDQWQSLPESISSGRLLALLEEGAEIGPTELEQMIALYDAGIVHCDHWIGRLMEALGDLDLARDTIVIVTSDHGEEFNEHGGYFHGRTLYQDQLHVPLILHVPPDNDRFEALKPSRPNEIVELIDVLPTMLDLASIERESLALEGESLMPLLRGRALTTSAAIADFGRTTVEGSAIITGDWKYVTVRPEPNDEISRMKGEYLFRLPDDSLEQRNLLESAPPSLPRLREMIEDLRADWEAEAAGRSTGRRGHAQNVLHVETMRKLGYIGNR